MKSQSVLRKRGFFIAQKNDVELAGSYNEGKNILELVQSNYCCQKYVNLKPFHVVRMIFSNAILGQKLVMITGKQTFNWFKTGFFSVCQLKK